VPKKTKKKWTVVSFYEDNVQPRVDFVEASSAEDAAYEVKNQGGLKSSRGIKEAACATTRSCRKRLALRRTTWRSSRQEDEKRSSGSSG
jgi:hypothetical protein